MESLLGGGHQQNLQRKSPAAIWKYEWHLLTAFWLRECTHLDICLNIGRWDDRCFATRSQNSVWTSSKNIINTEWKCVFCEWLFGSLCISDDALNLAGVLRQTWICAKPVVKKHERKRQSDRDGEAVHLCEVLTDGDGLTSRVRLRSRASLGLSVPSRCTQKYQRERTISAAFFQWLLRSHS